MAVLTTGKLSDWEKGHSKNSQGSEREKMGPLLGTHEAVGRGGKQEASTGLACRRRPGRVDLFLPQLASCLSANSCLALDSRLMMPLLSLLANYRTKLPRDSLNCHQQVWGQPHRSQNQGEQDRSEQVRVRTNQGPRHSPVIYCPQFRAPGSLS